MDCFENPGIIAGVFMLELVLNIYYLNRVVDVSGVSGTGIVAEVVEFTDGSCVVRWIKDSTLANVASSVFYDSKEDLLRVHGHNGNTILEEVY